MAEIRYHIPPIAQEASPICWLVCAVMIKGYMGNPSIDLKDYTGGFDPSNSSIPNPATSLPDLYQQLWDLGFVCVCPSKKPTESYLKKMLKEKGPLILTHRLYGEGLPPDATHSVVLTGIDTVRNKMYLSDPMRPAGELEVKTKDVISAIESLRPFGHKMLAYCIRSV